LNRINKDLKEINKSPLEGIGIISLDNDPKKYIVNIKIMSGIFKGYCIQLLLTFPDQYPIKPPRILIYPGQCFDNTYHHHIFRSDIKDDKDQYFNKFCFDLLDNDFLPTSSEAFTGWNPSYTISTLLLQVQTFLANPDFPTGYIPNKQKIDELMKSMDNYEKSFMIKNDNNEDIIKIHTWKNPYPEMYFKNNSYLIQTDKDLIENLEDNKSNYKQEIKENLTCFVSRLNYIDENNIILGYPIKKRKNGSLIPIPEILSYDSFIEELININNNYKFITQTIIKWKKTIIIIYLMFNDFS
jgi:ubiquitin-protein ligase